METTTYKGSEFENGVAKDRVTIKQWAMANPYGTYICQVTGHLVTVKNGKYYDSWDSGKKKIKGYYSKN